MDKSKNVIQNNKFEISAPTWNDKFELPDGSDTASNIQDYFEYIIKNHETLTCNLPIQKYIEAKKYNINKKISTNNVKTTSNATGHKTDKIDFQHKLWLIN